MWKYLITAACVAACVGHRPETGARPALPFTVVELRPVSGQTLAQQLVHEAGEAAARSQTPLIELTSRWCRTCFQLDRSFAESPMREALGGTYIIRMDVTRWSDHYGETGLGHVTMALPSFVNVFDRGHGIGPFLDARSWLADAPTSVAPSLHAFVESVVER